MALALLIWCCCASLQAIAQSDSLNYLSQRDSLEVAEPDSLTGDTSSYSPYQQGQEKAKRIPFWKKYSFTGLRVGADLVGPIRSLIQPQLIHNQFQGDIGFGPYFPTAEFGIVDYQPQNENFAYRATGTYVSAGLDYNITRKGHDLVYVGGRYGLGWMNHSLNSGQIVSDYFGAQQVDDLPQNLGVSYHWLEATFGMKVHLLYNVWMGYALRLRFKTLVRYNERLEPDRLLGYGPRHEAAMAGFNYYIMYRFGKVPKKSLEREGFSKY